MRIFSYAVQSLLLLCLLVAVGCQQKFTYEKNFTLTPGEVQSFPIDGPAKQQQVSIEVAATGSPVNIHVALEQNHAGIMEALTVGKKLDATKVLASQDKMESGTVEATVPAKTGFTVFVSGARKATDVKLKITGK